MLPELMEPLGPGLPSWLQWAFACVRSRAFKVGPEAFALVPLLDIANHSAKPNADFRAADSRSDSATAADADGGGFELFALEAIAAGVEVTVSYTGPAGYTNQRLMAQYGFVPEAGNDADRVAFSSAAATNAVAASGSAAAAASSPPPSASQASGSGGAASGGAQLRLERMQAALGDELFTAAVGGRDPYLLAALRSLPFAQGEESDAGASASSSSSSSSSSDSSSSPLISGQELATVDGLLAQCRAMLASGTSIADDLELLKAIRQAVWKDYGDQGGGQQTAAGSGGGSSSSSGRAVAGAAGSPSSSIAAPAAADAAVAAAADVRLAAAVKYRVERKRLLTMCAKLLELYKSGGGGGGSRHGYNNAE